MRSDPVEYELVAPGSLPAALSLLAGDPGTWLPIAGGTDVMVQYAAGSLPSRKLMSIWNFPELRRIEVLPEEIRIGAGCTYTDLRGHELLAHEFPLLARAASWIGGIANQNRGTLGGNIVNASPTADSLPALLVYDAELLLVSVRGERRLAYRRFHASYKKTELARDELVQAVILPRRFAGYVSYARKVGTRNAQAISKVCVAALGRLEHGAIADIRIAVGSVAPVPIRLAETERILTGKRIEPSLLALAEKTAADEIRPIDDIRSTARYRKAVVSNLVTEFLYQLGTSDGSDGVLVRWNGLPADAAESEIFPCCGSTAWAHQVVQRRPFVDQAALVAACDEVWRSLDKQDWTEAFRRHPRIGETRTEQPAGARSATWSAQEQGKAASTDDEIKAALVEANRAYEERFGRIFIVCASGKSTPEILELLRSRLRNDPETELREAAEQQRQIMQLRIQRWVQE